MEAFAKFLDWKQTRLGLIVSGLVEAGLAYGFGSWALDSGSGWHYLLAAIFLVGFITSFVKAVKIHGKR